VAPARRELNGKQTKGREKERRMDRAQIFDPTLRGGEQSPGSRGF